MSQPYTKEEVIKVFLGNLKGLINYWNNVDGKNTEEKLSGLAFSILALIDGGTLNLPALDIVLRPHPEDKDYHERRGEKYFEDGMAFNDKTMLHEIFYQ